MDNILTAQELKTKGAKILQEKTKKFKETIISVKGKNSYVVLTIDHYNYLRECELEAAFRESQADLKKGRFSIKSVKSHIKDLKNV